MALRRSRERKSNLNATLPGTRLSIPSEPRLSARPGSLCAVRNCGRQPIFSAIPLRLRRAPDQASVSGGRTGSEHSAVSTFLSYGVATPQNCRGAGRSSGPITASPMGVGDDSVPSSTHSYKNVSESSVMVKRPSLIRRQCRADRSSERPSPRRGLCTRSVQSLDNEAPRWR